MALDPKVRDSVPYTIAFATAVCVVCALAVSLAAVGLQPRQEANARAYMHKNVLIAAGLVQPGEKVSDVDVRRLLAERVEVRLLDFATAELLPADRMDALAYDQRRARNDPATSRPAPPNRAGIPRLPNYGQIYFVKKDGRVDQVVLAVEGLGMWGTIYGFVSLAPDGNTVRGLTYYDQKETPGLGGEIGNPSWQALWRGRKGYDEQGRARITVIKGEAGPPEQDPLHVDGLSGATITSNAITQLMQFWLSEQGYGRWLESFRKNAGGNDKGSG
jgi:Na+-transporting NADH:ubiquinone oxidoreductase subunit C